MVLPISGFQQASPGVGEEGPLMALYCGHRGHPWGLGEQWFPKVKETPPFHSEVGSGEWGGSGDGIWEMQK